MATTWGGEPAVFTAVAAARRAVGEALEWGLLSLSPGEASRKSRSA